MNDSTKDISPFLCDKLELRRGETRLQPSLVCEPNQRSPECCLRSLYDYVVTLVNGSHQQWWFVSWASSETWILLLQPTEKRRLPSCSRSTPKLESFCQPCPNTDINITCIYYTLSSSLCRDRGFSNKGKRADVHPFEYNCVACLTYLFYCDQRLQKTQTHWGKGCLVTRT